MKNSNIGVQLHSNGLYWQARWYDSVGKRCTESLGPKAEVSKRAAVKLCEALAITHAVTPAARDVGKAPTLEAWGVQYIGLRDDLKDGTLELHRKTLDYLEARFGGARRLNDITDGMADDFRVWLGKQPVRPGGGEAKTKRTLGKQTVAGHIRNCKVIFERARKRKLIPSNPFDDVSGAAPAVSKTWAEISRADLDRLFDKCPSAGWRCLFGLARLAGLRRGEALRLSWADFDQDARTLAVRPEGGEEGTKQRARVVPVDPRLYAVLREAYDEAPERAVLVCGLGDETAVDKQARAIIAAAGLPAYSKPFHTLRKLVETEWLAEHPAMLVCDWMGHSPTVAARHYHRSRAEDYARVTKTGTGLAQTGAVAR